MRIYISSAHIVVSYCLCCIVCHLGCIFWAIEIKVQSR